MDRHTHPPTEGEPDERDRQGSLLEAAGKAIKSGFAYVNVHTAKNAASEIRGQTAKAHQRLKAGPPTAIPPIALGLPMRFARVFALSLAAVSVLVGCGSTQQAAPAVYSPEASLASLHEGGWSGASAAGMPNTLTKTRQVGYLALTAPDDQQLDVQFFEDAAKAAAELASAQKQSTGFHGTTIANAFVFSHPDGKADVSSADLDELEKLLK